MPSRWEYLYSLKPVPLLEHLLEEVARLLAADLARWPPQVLELDLGTGGAFAPLFQDGEQRRPGPAVYAEALRLAQLELAREVEACDDYMRNRRYLERGLAPDDRLALLFLSRWLVEQMLALGEATQGRVKRAHMQRCLARLGERLRAGPGAGGPDTG